MSENKETFGSIIRDEDQTDKKNSVKVYIPKENKETEDNLFKSLTELLNGGKEHVTVERLAFESNPDDYLTIYSGLYQRRMRLIPDDIKKRIAIQDSLVSAIIGARQSHISSHGRPQPDRFSSGFKLELKQGMADSLTTEEQEELQQIITEMEKRLLNCGKKTTYERGDLMTFSDFLSIQTRNALVFGKIATEIVYTRRVSGSEIIKEFHSFRPIDAGTIYPVPKIEREDKNLDAIRERGLKELARINDTTIDPELFRANKYSWVQVIGDRPRAAFTPEECLVKNFYPVSDVELHGFPVAPIDTIISDITMHLNITTHNKLYFQNGRAARGMMVVKSSNVNQKTVNNLERHFRASINNAANSWRTPIVTMDEESDVQWVSLDPGHRDMEFQFLSDSNARVILSGFHMSPDEIPGYGHLSRGTNQQTVSESNNEYKLTAARDVGIRPLLAKFQDFVIQGILPMMDKSFPLKGARIQNRRVSEFITFRFVGLESSSFDKETEQMIARMDLDLSMNEILEKTEKNPLPVELGGDFIFNPRYQAVLDKYVKVGVILEKVFKIPGASADPQYDYVRDEFYFKNKEMLTMQASQTPPGQTLPSAASEEAQDAQQVIAQLEQELKVNPPENTEKLQGLLTALSKSLKR